MATELQKSGYAAYIPLPQVLDSEHVRMNLDAALVLAENGDLREATRWLRRAADAAEEDGSHQRAIAIARAAATLAAEIRATSLTSSSAPPQSALSSTLVSMVRQLKGLPDTALPEPERPKTVQRRH